MSDKNSNWELVFRAMGDRHRLQIMRELLTREMNAGELLEIVDVVQSTLSHHMRCLCDSGLVAARRDGKWTYYSLSPEAIERTQEFLQTYRLEPGMEIELHVPQEDTEEFQDAEPDDIFGRKKSDKKPENIDEKKSKKKAEKKDDKKSEKKADKKTDKKTEKKAEKKDDRKAEKKQDKKDSRKSDKKAEKKSDKKDDKKAEKKSSKKDKK